MNIPLRLIEPPPAVYAPLVKDGTIRLGDCWRDDWGGRPGWRIVLPNGTTWHTCQPASDGTHWDITGEPPDLTVHPSIFDHSPGREWHGWITGGELIPV